MEQKIIELKPLNKTELDAGLQKAYNQFYALLEELAKTKLPETTVHKINVLIQDLNSSVLSGNSLRKLISKNQKDLLKILEKDHKIVTKNHYRNLWMLLGISLGLPIGVAISSAIGNIGLLGVGIPIGIGLGLAIGSSLDEKAKKEGRQLNIEVKN